MAPVSSMLQHSMENNDWYTMQYSSYASPDDKDDPAVTVQLYRNNSSGNGRRQMWGYAHAYYATQYIGAAFSRNWNWNVIR